MVIKNVVVIAAALRELFHVFVDIKKDHETATSTHPSNTVPVSQKETVITHDAPDQNGLLDGADEGVKANGVGCEVASPDSGVDVVG